MAFEPFDLGRVIQTAEAIKGIRRQGESDKLRDEYLRTNISASQQQQKFAAQDQQAQMDAREAKLHYFQNHAIENAQDPVAAAKQMAPDIVKQFEATHGPGSFDQLTPDQVRGIARYAKMQAGAVAGIMPKTEWKDVGGQLVPFDEQGNPVNGVAPIAKGTTPDAQLAARTSTANAQLSASTSRANAQLSADTTRNTAQQNITGKLRDDYTQIVKSTGWADQQGFYQRLKTVANDKTGASDLALVFSYMKVLDPTSAVREGEYANAKNTASVPDWLIAKYNAAVDGRLLSPAQRKNFVAAADKIYKTSLDRQEAIRKDFTSKAERAKVNPQDVLVDFGAPQAADTASGQPAPQATVPSATGPNGQKLYLRNGQWVPQ